MTSTYAPDPGRLEEERPAADQSQRSMEGASARPRALPGRQDRRTRPDQDVLVADRSPSSAPREKGRTAIEWTATSRSWHVGVRSRANHVDLPAAGGP